jgi:hypothetical protein
MAYTDLSVNDQIITLHSCGINPIDAQQIASTVTQSHQYDPAWVPTLFELLPSSQINCRSSLVNAARVSWYMNVPTTYKRILDAEVE